jgi:hypothetical protein
MKVQKSIKTMALSSSRQAGKKADRLVSRQEGRKKYMIGW